MINWESTNSKSEKGLDATYFPLSISEEDNDFSEKNCNSHDLYSDQLGFRQRDRRRS